MSENLELIPFSIKFPQLGQSFYRFDSKGNPYPGIYHYGSDITFFEEDMEGWNKDGDLWFPAPKVPQQKQENLKLQAGQVWKTRDGRLAIVVCFDSEEEINPYQGIVFRGNVAISYQGWDNDGYILNEISPCKFDLVRYLGDIDLRLDYFFGLVGNG